MSYFPDCRTDENYNINNIYDNDKDFVGGFDWAVEMAVDNFFDNDMYDLADEESYLGHLLCEEVPEYMQEEYEMEYTFNTNDNGPIKETRTVKTYADLIRMKLLEWIEMERNMLITSMVDHKAIEEEDGQSDKED